MTEEEEDAEPEPDVFNLADFDVDIIIDVTIEPTIDAVPEDVEQTEKNIDRLLNVRSGERSNIIISKRKSKKASRGHAY